MQTPVAKTTKIGNVMFVDMGDGGGLPVFYGADDKARWIGHLSPQTNKKYKYHFGSYELRMSVMGNTFEEIAPLIEEAFLIEKL